MSPDVLQAQWQRNNNMMGSTCRQQEASTTKPAGLKTNDVHQFLAASSHLPLVSLSTYPNLPSLQQRCVLFLPSQHSIPAKLTLPKDGCQRNAKAQIVSSKSFCMLGSEACSIYMVRPKDWLSKLSVPCESAVRRRIFDRRMSYSRT